MPFCFAHVYSKDDVRSAYNVSMDSIAMKRIQASEFGTKRFRSMDAVARSGDADVKAKTGKPFCSVVPHREPRHSQYSLHANQIVFLDDIVAPVEETWTVDNRLSAPQEPDDRIAFDLKREHPVR